MQFSNLLIGAGTAYPIESIGGLDLPPLRTFDVPRVGIDGFTPGGDLYDGRVIRVRAGIDGTNDGGGLEAKVNELRRVLSRQVSASMPSPLSFQWYGQSRRFVRALPRRWAMNYDPETNALNLPTVDIEFEAPDPTILSATEQSQNLIPALPTAIVNSGTYPTWPVIRITGVTFSPVTPQAFTHLPSGQTVTLSGMTTVSSDVMLVDFATRTVTINGVNHYEWVDPTTQWWSLQPGGNMLNENDSSFETSVSGWTPASATTRRTTQYALIGEASMEVTATSTSPAQVATGFISALAATQYTALVSFRALATSRNAQVTVSFWNSSFVHISSSAVSTTDVTTGWEQVAVTATSPAGTAYIKLTAQINSPVATEKHLIDRVSLATGSATTWTTGQSSVVTCAGFSGSTMFWRDAWI